MCRHVCVTTQFFSAVFNGQNKSTHKRLPSAVFFLKPPRAPFTSRSNYKHVGQGKEGYRKCMDGRRVWMKLYDRKQVKKKNRKKGNSGRKSSWCQKSSSPCFPIKRTQGKNQGAPAATAVLFSSSPNMALKSNLQQHTWWGIKSAFSR